MCPTIPRDTQNSTEYTKPSLIVNTLYIIPFFTVLFQFTFFFLYEANLFALKKTYERKKKENIRKKN